MIGIDDRHRVSDSKDLVPGPIEIDFYECFLHQRGKNGTKPG